MWVLTEFTFVRLSRDLHFFLDHGWRNDDELVIIDHVANDDRLVGKTFDRRRRRSRLFARDDGGDGMTSAGVATATAGATLVAGVAALATNFSPVVKVVDSGDPISRLKNMQWLTTYNSTPLYNIRHSMDRIAVKVRLFHKN